MAYILARYLDNPFNIHQLAYIFASCYSTGFIWGFIFNFTNLDEAIKLAISNVIVSGILFMILVIFGG